MRRILLVAILLLSSCAFRMKHRWENGFSCRCRSGLMGVTCECEPTKIPQCPQCPQCPKVEPKKK